MLAGRFTGEYPFFRGAPATMAGVSAAWSFDRFFDERQSPPVKEEQGQPLQQQKGHGKEDGLERGEEVCHAAEDATVKFMHIEQGVDEVGGQGVYADNAEGKCPLGPFPFVPHINGQMKQGKKRQGNAGGSQDEGPRPHAGGAEKEKARSCHCRAEAHGGSRLSFKNFPAIHPPMHRAEAETTQSGLSGSKTPPCRRPGSQCLSTHELTEPSGVKLPQVN